MARLPNSKVNVRFTTGGEIVKSRQRFENFARTIAQRVLLKVASSTYEKSRDELVNRIKRDVEIELQHLASLYKRYIIGAPGTHDGPNGQLTTIVKGAPTENIADGLPPWAPRGAKYLDAKRRATGGVAWFDNSNWTLRTGAHGRKNTYSPDRVGLLRDETSAETWEAYFGPITVQFRRNNLLDQDPESVIQAGPNKRKMSVQLGTISVRAFGEITPAMLPGLSSGHVMASSAGNRGLINLIRDPDLAHRLGVMRNGVYRPTLEPFLGFFLTRAIPNAVRARLQQGDMLKLAR